MAGSPGGEQVFEDDFVQNEARFRSRPLRDRMGRTFSVCTSCFTTWQPDMDSEFQNNVWVELKAVPLIGLWKIGRWILAFRATDFRS
jgi:hypothetical protein